MEHFPKTRIFATYCSMKQVLQSHSELHIVKQGGTREYPSAFVMREDKSVTYIGNWNRIQELLDAESIDKAILEAHPEIVTFSSFFK